ncbi:Putative ribonuclease H protein At1g65750 [Linum grandiflorum]
MVQSVFSKYLRSEDVVLVPCGTTRFSKLWKGIKYAWHYMQHGTSFWKDCWVDGGFVLSESALGMVDASNVVADWAEALGVWDIRKLRAVLPESMVECVIGMDSPDDELKADIPVDYDQLDTSPGGLVMLECDGSVQTELGRVAAGGVIRNDQGKVLRAYSENLGHCSITMAEFRGVIYGVELAWHLGVRRLEIRVDSKCVVRMLNGGIVPCNQYVGLVAKFQRLHARDWEILITHVYCEANFFTDFMATRGHSHQLGIAIEETTSTDISYWENYDRRGHGRMRVIIE